MTYIDFVCEQLKTFQIGQPIYTRDISMTLALAYNLTPKEAVAATDGAFKQIIDSAMINDLRFYQKGIYYLTYLTPFGEVTINKECLIADKYLLPHIGYETGLMVLHQIGLTSQLPKERCFATNKATSRMQMDDNLGVLICPPKTTINEHNKVYLQFLDVLDLMNKAPVDVEHPYILLAKYIQEKGLDYRFLLSLADKYYNQKTILQLAHIASNGEKNCERNIS